MERQNLVSDNLNIIVEYILSVLFSVVCITLSRRRRVAYTLYT